jgi:hypothetical protein
MLMPTRDAETNARRFMAGAISGTFLNLVKLLSLNKYVYRNHLCLLYIPIGTRPSSHGLRDTTCTTSSIYSYTVYIYISTKTSPSI